MNPGRAGDEQFISVRCEKVSHNFVCAQQRRKVPASVHSPEANPEQILRRMKSLFTSVDFKLFARTGFNVLITLKTDAS